MARFHSTGDPVLDLGIFAVCASVTLAGYALMKHWPKLVYCLAKKTTQRATVRYVHAEAVSWNRYTGEERSHSHTAVFDLEDGNSITLHITHEDYIMLRKGVSGLLTRKGGQFISFEPGK